VGGTEGYRRFLAALRNPKDEEHAAMLDWVGGHSDSNAFR
jgi:hypothetical protein